jgi:RNA recognition motif-containing protein
MNIHVSNLPPNVSASDIKVFFEVFGKVEVVDLIINTKTGEKKGYAFVEMPSEEEALSTIETLNGKEWQGKTLVLVKANRQGYPAKRKLNRRR